MQWIEICDEASDAWSTLRAPEENPAMCGRISQYRGIHDFVAALSIPNALFNYASDQPFERYNAAPTTQLALFH